MRKSIGTGMLLLPLFMLLVLFATTAQAYDVSGFVNYSGSQTGRIYLSLEGSSGSFGTSIVGKGAYTIRGVPPGTYYSVRAYLDAQGSATQHITDLSGSSNIFNVANTNVTGVNVVLNGPPPVTSLYAPTFWQVVGGDNAAFVEWEASSGEAGVGAETYDLYWSTSPSVGPGSTVGGGSQTGIPAAGFDGRALLSQATASGVVNGNTLYFALRGRVGDVTSPLAFSGPVAIGPSVTGNTISGTVSHPTLASPTPLLVVVVQNSDTGKHFYISAVTASGSSTPYTVNGVADGVYRIYTVLDMNNNGIHDQGDLWPTDHTAPLVVVNGAAKSGITSQLSSASSLVDLRTNHGQYPGDQYSIELDLEGRTKLPVTAALTKKNGSPISPIDLSQQGGGSFWYWFDLGSTAPNVGDSYSLDVTYADGSSETVTGSVTGVIASLPKPVAPSGGSSVAETPTFTWNAPGSLPAGVYYYSLDMYGNGLAYITWNPAVPGDQTSVTYNFDGAADPTTLNSASQYSWGVSIHDAYGNSGSSNYLSFGAQQLAMETYYLPSATPGNFYDVQLQASGGVPPYNWSISSGVLPPTLSLDPSTGMISGTAPSEAGYYSFTVRVTDSLSATATSSLYLNVYPNISYPFLSTYSLQTGTVGATYSQTLSVSGGVSPYTFSYTGTLPPGISLDAVSGQLSGTPSASGQYSFMVQVTDASQLSSSSSLTLFVNPGSSSSYTLRSRVIDGSSNSALSGVLVEVIGDSGGTSTTSDANGFFSFPAIPAATPFRVKLSLPGYADSFSSYMSLAGNLDISDRPYALYPPAALSGWGNSTGKGVIRSRVVDGASQVDGYIGGAVVSAVDSATSAVYPVLYYNGTAFADTGATDGKNGIYLVTNVPAGATVNVTASKNGYAFGTRSFLVAADSVSQGRITGNPVTAPGTTYYAGNVADANNAPLAGVTVEMIGGSGIATTTLSDGSYALTGLPSGSSFSLRFAKTGFADSFITNIISTSGIAIAGRPVSMFPTSQLATWGVASGNGVIRGRVVDSANMNTGYLGGAVVTAVDSIDPRITYPVSYQADGTGGGTSSTAAGNGIFMVANVPANAKIVVSAVADGWKFSPRIFTVFADGVSQGRIGGTPASSTPLNGTCGIANGMTFSAPPAGNLCQSGNASPVNGSGPWNWSCMGQNGGTSATCNAYVSTGSVSNGTVNYSGIVSYSGSKTGRIYLTVQTPRGTLGTSIPGPGSYTIRGVPAGSSNIVNAYMDSLGRGVQVQTSPAGSGYAPTSMTSPSGVAAPGSVSDIVLSDFAPLAPPEPTGVFAYPGAGSVLIRWDKGNSNSNIESADSYDIYWGTSPSLTKANATGSRPDVPSGMDAPAVLAGLNDGSSYYFIVVPKSGGVEGAASAVFGPVVVGAGIGGNTVTGSVNLGGITPAGPLYVAVVTKSDIAEQVYFTIIPNPTAVQNFSLSGIPNGIYNVYTILDQNHDSLIGTGDIMNDNDRIAPLITLTGSGASNVAVTLSPANAVASVSTGHWISGGSDGYNIDYRVEGQTKRPVAVTLASGPAISGPIDMGLNYGEFQGWMGVQPRPNVGDVYTFEVLYSDGTSETLTASVSAVLSSFATNLQTSGVVSTTPTFTWGAPLSTPPAGYHYSLRVQQSGPNGQYRWYAEVPASELSVVYAGEPLSVGVSYDFYVAVVDDNGNRSEAAGLSFTPVTAIDSNKPTVVATTPGNNATSVPVSQTISVRFIEAMNPATLSATNFVVTAGGSAVEGTVAYSGTTAVFTPAAPLGFSTVYSVTISGGQDLAGNVMLPVTFTFTTAAANDTTAPMVQATTPASGATRVPLSQSISITFSEPMAAATIDTGSITVSAGSVSVQGTVSYSGSTATFTPSSPLSSNTLYTVRVGVAVTDLAGNHLANPYSSSWTTLDTTPPTFTFTTPVNNATNVAVNAVLTGTFSKAIDETTLPDEALFLKTGNTYVPGTGHYDAATKVATFTPAAPLSPSTVYTATMSGVKDLSGNVMAPITFTFTTAAPVDTTAPTVLSTTPANGASNVALNQTISIVFSEQIKVISQTALASSVVIKAGTTQLLATGSYNPDSNTLTIQPLGGLTAGVTYSITVNSGITDLAGNKLAPFTYSFSTVPPLPNGDLDGSGSFDIADVSRALAVAVGRIQPSAADVKNGDVAPLINGKPSPDQVIDVADVVVLLRRLAGLINW